MFIALLLFILFSVSQHDVCDNNTPHLRILALNINKVCTLQFLFCHPLIQGRQVSQDSLWLFTSIIACAYHICQFFYYYYGPRKCQLTFSSSIVKNNCLYQRPSRMLFSLLQNHSSVAPSLLYLSVYCQTHSMSYNRIDGGNILRATTKQTVANRF